MGKAGGQAPGPRVKPAREVVDFLHRLVADVIVIFELIGDLGHARAGDGAEVVIPPIDALVWFAVVWGPAEIGGVDIGGQPVFKAVHLIGADEVHLA